MRKTYASSNSFGGVLSLGAPSYIDNKGWSSERVPNPSSTTSTAAINGGCRHIGSASALTTPFTAAERYLRNGKMLNGGFVALGVCQNPSVSSHFSEQRRQKSRQKNMKGLMVVGCRKSSSAL